MRLKKNKKNSVPPITDTTAGALQVSETPVEVALTAPVPFIDPDLRARLDAANDERSALPSDAGVERDEVDLVADEVPLGPFDALGDPDPKYSYSTEVAVMANLIALHAEPTPKTATQGHPDGAGVPAGQWQEPRSSERLDYVISQALTFTEMGMVTIDANTIFDQVVAQWGEKVPSFSLRSEPVVVEPVVVEPVVVEPVVVEPVVVEPVVVEPVVVEEARLDGFRAPEFPTMTFVDAPSVITVNTDDVPDYVPSPEDEDEPVWEDAVPVPPTPAELMALNVLISDLSEFVDSSLAPDMPAFEQDYTAHTDGISAAAPNTDAPGERDTDNPRA